MSRKVFAFLCSFVFILMFFHSSVAHGEYSNELHRWNFKPSKNNEPATTEPHYEALLHDYGGFYIGNTDEKELYLTFDNGYENGVTADVLDVLKEKEVPAAFFVTGHFLAEEQELIHRMVDEGHIVGNHSYHHPNLVNVSDERIERELESLRKLFEEVTGIEEMNYLRPPQGTFSERTLALTQEMGYTNVFWSFAYVDWFVDRQKGWKHAYDSIMKRVHPGAVLLLHSVSTDNAEALPKVIDDLHDEGYTFKTLDELSLQKQKIPVTNEERR
ncbi:delta-lactam-biosynthetic de-N-acetylase [Texcoconibacillus texcoconensis]|uniref:Peptidoglycan-N-acetylmuramic acid deacetylase n=1 Tax=Texcoconibacillus texcoconensis TaxID=1095777 RepID=A0A840QTG2_9BACI|nr:delta-lactam-biosynthetic de-N-acetylase [Texcoconibacillus texcoconensis]MBB5174655.1 peptidoglycan-N-acetylmuramic acid deacetylase [Texcoconibacillus texcoconensis]